MDIEKYIGYYRNCVPSEICDSIMNYESYNFTKSTYSAHDGKLPNSDERVKMDECWVRAGGPYYQEIKDSYELVIQRYAADHPTFAVDRTTDFRINRYGVGGFMSNHADLIHHSHGQEYGFPQVSALLYLNDDYEGGEFYVACKKFQPEKGSAIIFPSNFMFRHEALTVTKGTRWSIVTWLM
jgi:hypothetical protein